MLICWHLEEGFNADVIGGVLSLHYEFSMGKGTYKSNHESPCYIHSCIECTHMPFQFLAEVVAEFYDFSAFSPFLTFNCC